MSCRTLTFTLVCTLFFLANAAHAMKIHIDMKPSLDGEEFVFEMNPKENGKVAFVVKRDPCKAIEPADSKLRLVRGASLSVYGDDGFVARCPIAPETDQDGIEIPKSLKVEASPEVLGIVKDFLCLRDAESSEELIMPPGSTESRIRLSRATSEVQLSRVGNQTGGLVYLFLFTDDFWRDFQSYTAKGVVYVREPREESYGTVAVFQDVYGNLWDLLQPRT